MPHDKECIEGSARADRLRGEYESSWPNYCRTCDSWGVLQYEENLGPDGRYWPYTFTDPCPDCSDKGICPRCGQDSGLEWVEDDGTPCPNCGWNWGNDEGDTIEPEWECWCTGLTRWE